MVASKQGDTGPPGEGAAAWTWSERASAGLRLGLLKYDVADRDVNVLTEASLRELDVRLDAAATSGVDGVIVMSGKPGVFIAGADVDAIAAIGSAEEGAAKAALGQRVLSRFSRLGLPTVAVIEGACVGGGAELAAWCSARVASTDDRTRIGFPEVRLGIVPGFGGTQLLPPLVGLPTALFFATTGTLVAPRRALAAGLVDAVVPSAHLLAEAAEQVRRLRGERRPHRTRLVNFPLVRDVIAGVARRRARAASAGHYPAPVEAVRLCRLALSAPLADGLADEARTVGRLATTRVAKNLIHVHDLTRSGGRTIVSPPADAQVGVVGAGVMGGGIAGVAVTKGFHARVSDVSAQSLAHGVTAARDVAARALRNADRPRVAVRRAQDRLSYGLVLDGLAGADLVVEAVVERADVKASVLARIEAAVSERCLVATNTSSLSVSALARSLRHRDRFAGLHFFNPVPKMPLVEIARGEETSPQTVERLLGWAKALGKHAVVVRDSPGFLVNRLLMPYLAEAIALQEAGVRVQDVDRAAVEFGMPVGPFELLDEVGLDVAAHVARTFAGAWPDRFTASALLERLVTAGRLGRKTGGGFYDYRSGKRRAPWSGLGAGRRATDDDRVVDRLFLRMADEAFRCLGEEVVASSREVDLATVFGIGFPPFRGGLCRWVEQEGAASLRARADELAQRFGPRFASGVAWS